MVNEGMGTISLQLNAEGVYTTCFNVSVICFDIFPVQAKGEWWNTFVPLWMSSTLRICFCYSMITSVGRAL